MQPAIQPAAPIGPGGKAANRTEAIFYALCVFLVCGFLGWVYETLAVRVANGIWQARGFLFVMDALQSYIPALSGTWLGRLPLVWGLPLVQIYGVGGAIMCLAFRGMRCHPVRVFFTGLVSLSLLELLASYFCQYVLGQVYWSYNYPLSFQGRISLFSALIWGALSVVAVKAIGPAITRFYNRESCNHKHFHAAIAVLIAYVVVCNLVKFVLDPGIVLYDPPA